ncbi:MAG: hypothetical protein ACTHN5_18025 [Phycisphaerae bacterium]
MRCVRGRAGCGARVMEVLESRVFLSGSVPGVADLWTGIGYGGMPAYVVSGSGTKLSFPIFIWNEGNGQAVGTTDYTFYAENVETGEDLLIQRVRGLKVNFAAGDGDIERFGFTVPRYIPAGTYRIKGVVNESRAIHETNLENNSDVFPDAFYVVHGFYNVSGNFAGSFYGTKLPAAAITGRPINGTIAVTVRNEGNLAFPKVQQVRIRVVAHDAAQGIEKAVGLSGVQNVSELPAWGYKVIKVPISVPTGLPLGTYRYEATITPVQALAESRVSDNFCVSDSFKPAWFLRVTVPNFAVTAGKATLPAGVVAGSKTVYRGSVPVTIKNLAADLPVGQRLTVSVGVKWAIVEGGLVRTGVTPIYATTVSASGMKVGQVLALTLRFTFDGRSVTAGRNFLAVVVTIPETFDLRWQGDVAPVLVAPAG